MKTEDESLEIDFTRIEQYALLLAGIRDFWLGKKSMIRNTDIPEILMDFINNESKLLTIDYAFAYFAIKNDLVTEKQYEDAITQMTELMGWESQLSKSKVQSMLFVGQAIYSGAFYDFKKAFNLLNEALKLYPNNSKAWHWLSELHKEDGNFAKSKECQKKAQEVINNKKTHQKEKNVSDLEPKIAFKMLFDLFYTKKDIITNLWKKECYTNVIRKEEGVLSQICSILNDVRNFFRTRDHYIPEDYIANALEDVIEPILEFMSIISGIAYYSIKYKLGNENQKAELQESLKDILGWKDDISINDYKEKNNSIAEDEFEGDNDVYLDEIDDEEYGDDFYQSHNRIQILFESKGFGTLPVSVIDYEDEEVRKNLIDPSEKIILDENIKIRFSYPLSIEVDLDYYNKDGFSRLDLFRCIYEGYKKIYAEEEAAVGETGTVSEMMLNRAQSNGPYGIWGHYLSDLMIEGIYYDSTNKIVTLVIGS